MRLNLLAGPSEPVATTNTNEDGRPVKPAAMEENESGPWDECKQTRGRGNLDGRRSRDPTVLAAPALRLFFS